MVIPNGDYLTTVGAPSGGQQAVGSAGTPIATSANKTDSDSDTDTSLITVLNTDVEKSLGLLSVTFDVLTNDLFIAAIHLPSVVGSSGNAAFELILKETTSGTIIAQATVEIGNTLKPLDTALIDTAAFDDPATSIEVLATGITGTITIDNTVGSGARLTLIRSRPQTFDAVPSP